jgi:hypothetical protein
MGSIVFDKPVLDQLREMELSERTSNTLSLLGRELSALFVVFPACDLLGEFGDRTVVRSPMFEQMDRKPPALVTENFEQHILR